MSTSEEPSVPPPSNESVQQSPVSPENDNSFSRGGQVFYGIIIIIVMLGILVLIFHRPPAAKYSCIVYLKMIDGAIQQWALENHKKSTDPVNMEEAVKYLKGGLMPTCPQGGTYSFGPTVDDAPICSLRTQLGHSLP